MADNLEETRGPQAGKQNSIEKFIIVFFPYVELTGRSYLPI